MITILDVALERRISIQRLNPLIVVIYQIHLIQLSRKLLVG